MNDLYEYIIHNVTSGKIDQQVGIQILKKLKQGSFTESKGDIAIIGISAKFPCAEDVEEFWENLQNGRDCFIDLPGERKKDIIGQAGVEPKIGGYLSEIDKFDYKFFKLSPTEAILMDPNQRLFLQTVWQTIEDAGYGCQKLSGSKTGLYVGYSNDFGISYRGLIMLAEPESLGVSTPGNIKSIIASRISYILDLKGPSMIIDTACSSSLVAVHLACQAIRNGECEMALAGGVTIMLMPPKQGSNEGGIGIESADGRVRTFDNSSDGTGLGEGVAAILLKPLDMAMKDRDNIYAVIKGSAINQDGSSIGITAPNAFAQRDAILKAWKEANIDPETISYIEAHGTGTKLGDPIEIEGIEKAFRLHSNKKQFCAIGAVKTNIGHLGHTAGIAGLIKAVLALRHRQIPPTLHFNSPNQRIDFIQSPVYIIDKLTEWVVDRFPRRCGVSAFGISGTNSHIILEEAPHLPESLSKEELSFNILTISAKSESALRKLVNKYQRLLEGVYPDIGDICFTANTGRGHYNYRIALIIKSDADLKEKIAILSKTEFKDLNFQDIFYGEPKIFVGKKRVDNDGITEAEKMQKTESAGKILAQIMNDKRQNMICSLYIEGADINWEELYKDRTQRRVSLPVYPFDKERCWLKSADVYTKKLDTIWNQAPDSEFRFGQPVADMYYEIGWTQAELTNTSKPWEQKATLIFKGVSLKAQNIYSVIQSQNNEMIEVELGEGYQKIDANRYRIGHQAADYKALLADINERAITRIVHAMSLAEYTTIRDIEELEDIRNRGLDSLFHLTQGLLESRLRGKIELIIISDYADEITQKEVIIKPGNSALLGFVKVIGQEYKNIRCKSIDIDNNTPVEKIIAEITVEAWPGKVAYRDGKRYVEEFREVDLKRHEPSEIPIKDQGVYLITGGTGGIGMEIGKYLASQNKIKLALISRSGLPDRVKWDEILERGDDRKLCAKLEAIRKMEETGTEVVCYSADVANEAEMTTVINELRNKYGRINGIIHSAGVAGDGFIIKKDKKVFDNVVNPKIKGIWLLDKLTGKDELDFFVMFSSTASFMGGLGQGDYTAANAFLDSYASYMKKQGKKALTIQWPAWKETGMAVDYGVNQDGSIFKAIDTQAAINCFRDVIKYNFNKIIIAHLNLNNYQGEISDFPIKVSFQLSERMKRILASKVLPKKAEERNNVVTRITGKETTNDIEKKIAQIWAQVLGLEEIDIYQSFSDLGGNSILASYLAKEMEKKYGDIVNITDIFAYPTIAEMAGYISGKINQIENSAPEYSDENALDILFDKIVSGKITDEELDDLL